MMSRLLHSIPRGLRHKAQAWAGNSSQKNHQQEENIRNGLGAAPLSNDAQASDKRSAHPLHHSSSSNSLVRHTQCKWDGGWRSFAGKREWDSYKGKRSSYTSHDALEWGTALMVSLHLCRVLTAATLPDHSSGGKKKLLASVVDTLPGLWRKPVGSLSLLGQQEVGRRKVTKSQQENPEPTPLASLAAAVAQLQAVTNQSVGQAHNSLGMKLSREGSLKEAASHFMEGSKVGFSRATFNLAVCYEQGRGIAQDLEKAADLYRRATSQGHPQAHYNLGVFHLKGKGGVQQDTALALELIASAAAAGVTQAHKYLGIHFLENTEHRDEKKAATFLQKAVDKQDTDAQYRLGLCYEHGWGIPMNSAKAASLYHKAALKGQPEALYSLARFHELGLGGLPMNRESAVQFYKQASEAGHEQATEYLKQLQCGPTADTSHTEHRADGISWNKENENLNLLQTGEHSHTAVNNKILHMSVSAPSLRHDNGKEVDIPLKESTNKRLAYMNSKFSMSHLSLLIPYCFSLPSRPSLMGPKPSGGQRSNVTFRVGDDDEAGEEEKADDAAYSHGRSGLHVPNPWLTVS